MIVELDLQRAVLEEIGRSGAADLVHLVEPGPGEGGVGSALGKIEAGLKGAEGDLAVAVGADDRHGGRDQVEIVALRVGMSQ